MNLTEKGPRGVLRSRWEQEVREKWHIEGRKITGGSRGKAFGSEIEGVGCYMAHEYSKNKSSEVRTPSVMLWKSSS